MGIHDRVDPLRRVVQISDLAERNPGNDTSDDSSSVASEQPPSFRPPRRTKNSRAAALDFQSLTERLQGRSKRYTRRHNHLSVVRTLVGLQESEIETEFSWTPENYGRSIFASLFAETSKMEAWNAFIELNEEDQMCVIDNQDCAYHGEEDCAYHGEEEELPNVDTKETGGRPTIDNDKRALHPSYSSAACFRLIDPNIKNVLSRRHLPLGFVESLELGVRSCFGCDPSYAVFEASVGTSFGRLLTHAVAQYLGLASISCFNDGGSTIVSIVSKDGQFNPPAQLLCQYLEWKSGKHIPRPQY